MDPSSQFTTCSVFISITEIMIKCKIVFVLTWIMRDGILRSNFINQILTVYILSKIITSTKKKKYSQNHQNKQRELRHIHTLLLGLFNDHAKLYNCMIQSLFASGQSGGERKNFPAWDHTQWTRKHTRSSSSWSHSTATVHFLVTSPFVWSIWWAGRHFENSVTIHLMHWYALFW